MRDDVRASPTCRAAVQLFCKILGLGSGISSMISTLVALVLYDMAGLVLAKRLRSEGLLSTEVDAWHSVS